MIGFRAFPERLLLDARTHEREGPLVAVVAPVSSIEERYAWLAEHRKGFPPPEDFGFAVWPLSIAALRERDALGPMRERIAERSDEAAEAFERAFDRLALLERGAIAGAIRGDGGWQSLWPPDKGSAESA